MDIREKKKGPRPGHAKSTIRRTEWPEPVLDQMDAIVMRLRDTRLQLGYSLEEVATRIGVSDATVWKWENGFRPSFPYLVTWVLVLGLSIEIGEIDHGVTGSWE